MIRNATIGGAIWLGLVTADWIAARLERSWIELLFLFAPLVIVSLGLEVTSRFAGSQQDANLGKFARRLQFPAALAAAFSFYASSRPIAAALAIVWLAFALLLAADRALRVLKTHFRHFGELCALAAATYLSVGAAWLLASRLGWRPMNFAEPIVLLTAVHFHYAGFAAATLVGALGAELKKRSFARFLYRGSAAGALGGPALLAAGFVAGPVVKLVAAITLATSEIALAFCFVACVRGGIGTPARSLLLVSALSVAAAMCLAAAWALGEFPRQPFLDIARMAAWHGSLNAFGFAFCGLAGFAFRDTSIRGHIGT